MKLVVLDRDGVINQESPEFIKSPEEWIPIKGSLEAIARLSQAGYDVLVLTNQSAVGRGIISADMLGQIHVSMMEQVRHHGGQIQCVVFCPHHPDDGCDCRKPKAGMYTEVAERLNLSFSGIYSVGDSERDLLAAKAAGATPVLVTTGNGRKTLQKIKANNESELAGTLVFSKLIKFVDALLAGDI